VSSSILALSLAISWPRLARIWAAEGLETGAERVGGWVAVQAPPVSPGPVRARWAGAPARWRSRRPPRSGGQDSPSGTGGGAGVPASGMTGGTRGRVPRPGRADRSARRSARWNGDPWRRSRWRCRWPPGSPGPGPRLPGAGSEPPLAGAGPAPPGCGRGRGRAPGPGNPGQPSAGHAGPGPPAGRARRDRSGAAGTRLPSPWRPAATRPALSSRS
jgi:hypothetical protein